MAKTTFDNNPYLSTDRSTARKMTGEKGVQKTEDEAADKLPPTRVEQFVMAYGIDQDRIRAMLPEGYESLRPVLRINAEIRDEQMVYIELNAPVASGARKGWLNIANWTSSNNPEISFEREGNEVTITAPFLYLKYVKTGIEGGCPAEKDNDGCFYIGEDVEFRPAETISENKEFCDCEFAWTFHEGDASGKSEGRTIPAFAEPVQAEYEHCELTGANAAAIACRQVLGSYVVNFDRKRG